MLSKQDKKWVKDTVGGALTGALAIQTEILTKTFSELLIKTVHRAINELRIELTQVMAEGFAECASSKEMAEVKANLGSLEQRFTWMHGAMVTKDYFDERMRDHVLKEETIHKQHSQKTARLVNILRNKKMIKTGEANLVLACQPHSQKLLSK